MKRARFTAHTGRVLGILLAAVIVYGVARMSLFVVVGASMEPTLSTHELVVAVPILPWKNPIRGHVVVVRRTPRHSLAIKRITGTPGDCVDPFGQTTMRPARAVNVDPCSILGHDQFFLLGDNRRSSTDSRSYGSVPREAISARVVFRIWPALATVDKR